MSLVFKSVETLLRIMDSLKRENDRFDQFQIYVA